jgi:hypothetical protein
MSYETLISNIEVVLSLVYLIWLFGWSKKLLGSAKLAILFSVIVVYLTFFQFRELIWVPVALFLFSFFGSFLEKLKKSDTKPDYLRD